MTDPATVDLLPLQPRHLEAAARLSGALCWPHRPQDWRVMAELGDGAVAAAAGKVVGTAMWWSCGGEAGTVGMIIVDPDWRGRGLGRRLLTHALGALAPRAAMLNATAVGVPLYSAAGFVAAGAIRQYQGMVCPASTATELPSGLREARTDDADAIVEFDARAFGAPRRALLERLLGEASFIVAAEGEPMTGFACRRRFGRGTLIGPIAATNEATAAALARACLSRSDGFVRADIPGDAQALARVLTDAGLTRVDEVLTMRRGAWPKVAGARIFGLASQAFG